MDPRSSLGIGPRFRRCSGSLPGVRKDFAEGIGKIARNMPRDQRRMTMRLTAGNAKGCKGLVFTQRRLVVDTDGLRRRGLGEWTQVG
ncbi:hypothetical protein BHE74_00047185 [Ensete ventricosum]|nr:hypothetical protein GW17_00055870 [Ensete ventricosum]RWW46865.1 hypothetical protein BHE74_00047185 [Ensete ventricosum]